ncbi:MAG: CocE/NonD family hydrolase [Acidobacteriota bacterium]|nr:CocE/NonD family hydrolase [Acidobacteriota bacterium]
MKKTILLLPFIWTLLPLSGQQPDQKEYVRANYNKFEHRIPMRDGVRLFTAVYAPNDRSRTYPILLYRTPYSSRPYGADRYRSSLGPTPQFARDGYIFVYQDVRGRYMSEGDFVQLTPHLPEKRTPQDIDESTDTYDTIEWLVTHLPGHNGRVGQWGISYPGFYTAAGMIDTHPALKAASPQAPIGDFYFDDFHHHGAFFLAHAFSFFARHAKPRPQPTTEPLVPFEYGTPDGYQFFLDLGPLTNINRVHLKGEIEFWNQMMEHPRYDAFWSKRGIVRHLKNVRCAVMTVGGWFDAEDLYGPLEIYRSVERNNPEISNVLVMGPWAHGDWGRRPGTGLGNARFGFDTSDFYRKRIIRPFFRHHLKQAGKADLPEAYVFETGANRWRTFDSWPPPSLQPYRLYLRAQGDLSAQPPETGEEGSDEYVSDPAKPVPFSQDISPQMTREYMTDDQRFAARRPDVLAYQTPVLEQDLTVAGPLEAELWVSTTAGDADWVVKLIDVLPDSAPDNDPNPRRVRMGGYQMMIRSEVIRGRFRNSYEHPEPFEPGRPTRVRLPLQDVFHTFKAGHRVMVQIQSSWFPLVDRNPQKYVPNIFKARAEDFIRATHRVYRSPRHATHLKLGVMEPLDPGGGN